MYFSETLAAGAAGAKEINEAGTFVRILSSAAEDLTLTFYRDGREVGTVQGVGAGYWESLAFDRIRVSSAAGGLVNIVTRIGAQVGYDRAVGSVALVGTVSTIAANGAFTQAQANVTNASTGILAYNAGRRYLLIQNNDGAAIVYLNLNGAAATAAGGIKLAPGQSLEIQGRCPISAITAIGSVASNTNVIVVEG